MAQLDTMLAQLEGQLAKELYANMTGGAAAAG